MKHERWANQNPPELITAPQSSPEFVAPYSQYYGENMTADELDSDTNCRAFGVSARSK
jgi:hypothetical protein